MLKNLLYSLILFYFSSLEAQSPIRTVPITLKIPVSSQENSWGLMQCSFLPENEGMLFTITDPGTSYWMFNCLIDLSIAFIDQKGTILEIHEMKAYPELMDPRRPVKKIEDFAKYTEKDPVVQFFHRQAVHAPPKSRFALEMNGNWFRLNHINIGDRLEWNQKENICTIHVFSH